MSGFTGKLFPFSENTVGHVSCGPGFIGISLRNIRILFLMAQVVPEDIPAADADLQFGIFLRMTFGFFQHPHIKNIEVDCMIEISDIRHHQRTHGDKPIIATGSRRIQCHIKRKIGQKIRTVQRKRRLQERGHPPTTCIHP